MSCKCKVGRCPHCPSLCRRCGCACDGVNPEDSLQRKRGQRGRRKKTVGTRVQRKAAALANELTKGVVEKLLEDKDRLCELRKLESVGDIWQAFDLPEWTRKKLPQQKERETSKNLKASNREGWNALVAVTKKIVHFVADILYPAKPEVLATTCASKIHEYKLDQNTEVVEKFKKDILPLLQNAPRRSIQGRVLRVVLTKCFSVNHIKELKEEYKRKVIEEYPDFYANEEKRNGKGTRGELHFSNDSRTAALKDFRQMQQGDELCKTMRKLVRYDEEAASRAVKFILSEENVGTLSWGQKTVKLSNGESVILPKLIRQKTKKEIYSQYCKVIEGELRENVSLQTQKIGRTSFYKILKSITSSDQKLLTAVDYVTGILLNDQTEILQDIIDDFAPNGEMRRKFTNDLTLVRNFLKNQYSRHLKYTDDVPSHDWRYALQNQRSTKRKRGRCNACEFPSKFFRDLEELVQQQSIENAQKFNQDQIDDVTNLIPDIEYKMVKLYRGHLARVLNQQVAIDSVLHRMEKKCLETRKTTEGVLVMDWKMKWEQKSAREQTTQHYGKRGISWHGMLLIYYVYKEIQTNQGTKPTAVRHMIYCDQIMDGDNKQDTYAVASMLEAFLLQIKEILPDMRSITLQSDNAKCYSTPLLLLLISCMNASLGEIRVTCFIHTVTQDGKGLIDAHFARGTYHCIYFMKTSVRNRVRLIATPRGLAWALAWNGGIQNSFVQLVRLNRAKLVALKTVLEPLAKKCKEFFSRLNHVIFYDSYGEWTHMRPDTIEAISKAEFRFRGFHYSGINEGVLFHVSMAKKQVEVVSSIETCDRAETSCADSNYIETLSDSSESSSCSDSCNEEENGVDINQPNEEPDFVNARRQQNRDTDDTDAEITDTNSVSGSDDSAEEGSRSDDHTQVELSAYIDGDPEKGVTTFTGVYVVKRSTIGPIIGPRNVRSQRSVPSPDCEPRSKDVVAYSARVANLLVQSESVCFRDGLADMEEYKQCEGIELSDEEFSLPGWGRRPRHGHQYGTKLIESYKLDIKEMFDEGAQDDALKLNPSMMREKLKAKYPFRYSIPGETEIRQEISSILLSSKQQNVANDAATGADPRILGKRKRRNTKLPIKYIETFEGYLDESLSLKPKDAYDRIVKAFTDNNSLPADFPSKKILLTKFSALKNVKKKQAKVSNL